MNETAASAVKKVPEWVWIAVALVALWLFLRSGFLSSVFKLGTSVADAANAAVKTTRRVAADFDPFNHRGRAAAVLRAVDPSKPVKKLGRAIDPSKAAKKVGRAVRKLKFW